MDWLLAAWWTTLLWLTSATGLDPTGLISSAISPGQSFDILEALGLSNRSYVGVTRTARPHSTEPAYMFQGELRELKLPPAAFQEVSNIVRHSPEFTIMAFVQQDEGNTGTLLSFAHGFNRYLELQSSGRQNEIRLHYTSLVDSKVNVETFHYKLADNNWHHVALSVSGSQAELLVDCQSLYKRLLKFGAPDRNFTEPQQLWLGQRNKHYHFKGSLSEVRLIAGSHGYLSHCSKLDASCPTCGQFSLLQSTVQELTRHLKELSERLVAAEGRISKVEECDCQKSCWVNKTAQADGARWQDECDVCTCVHGEVQCNPVECPVLDCKKPVKTGECCQICLRKCFFQKVFYDHGDKIQIKQCTECECMDGNMKCTKINPESCPKIGCPLDQQFSVPGECCKFCPGVDYCAKGHICHSNASCLNLQTTYTCHCDQGFQGNGHTCSDIDECQQEGGLDGHHCHLNTKCVNTKGSYVCECLPGFRQVDKFNCVEFDECSTGVHNCDAHANCINTQGSYHCVCQEGYSGNGYTCAPVCNRSCLNGGLCQSPGQCSCPNGYTGLSCERDVDECSSNLHRCTDSSVCVNMIGWYYCSCKPGYNSTYIENNLGTLCQDVNECERDLHTCHKSANCVNSDGGYYCDCPKERGPGCRLNCMFEGTEVGNGLVLSPTGKPCIRCTCNRGVMHCKEPTCNCSDADSVRSKCCPQCDPQLSCNHQELSDVILMHGERWSYQCQTCECLNGEVDCWDLKCPQLSCANPIKDPGDCCPRCGDRCPMGSNASHSGGEPCMLEGRLYESGAQFADPTDPCAACNCQNGVLCCSYNINCDDNARARTVVGYDGVAPAVPRLSAAQIDNNKQYSAGIGRVANGSVDDVINIADTLGDNDNKTEGTAATGG